MVYHWRQLWFHMDTHVERVRVRERERARSMEDEEYTYINWHGSVKHATDCELRAYCLLYVHE